MGRTYYIGNRVTYLLGCQCGERERGIRPTILAFYFIFQIYKTLNSLDAAHFPMVVHSSLALGPVPPFESQSAGKTQSPNAMHQSFVFYAEREGFEPSVPCGTLVFKTSAIDHSAISPLVMKRILPETCIKI